KLANLVRAVERRPRVRVPNQVRCRICIFFACVYSSHMARTAAILGTAGYSGQETLDRVLAHPELELVALGSDSLAGEGAGALDPRLNGSLPAFVTNAEAAASGADVLFLCLDNEASAAFEPPEGAVVVDLAGAHRLVGGGSARGRGRAGPGAGGRRPPAAP